MISYALLGLMTVLFIEMVARFQLLNQCLRLWQITRETLSVLGDADIDDHTKERTARTQSTALLRTSLGLCLGFVAIAALLWALLLAAVALAGLSILEFEQTSLAWPTLLGLTLFAVLYARWRYGPSH